MHLKISFWLNTLSYSGIGSGSRSTVLALQVSVRIFLGSSVFGSRSRITLDGVVEIDEGGSRDDEVLGS